MAITLKCGIEDEITFQLYEHQQLQKVLFRKDCHIITSNSIKYNVMIELNKPKVTSRKSLQRTVEPKYANMPQPNH